jgi:hypothetical protein
MENKYNCKVCGKDLSSEGRPELIDICYGCVKAKQPNGVFSEHKYIQGTTVKKDNEQQANNS